MRKEKEELDKIKEKHNIDRLWSWSRYNTYENSPSEYFLKYIKRETPDRSGTTIWGVSGTHCHDILEDYYLGNIKYEDCITRYENSLFDMQLAELKYDRMDEEMNAKISDKYENSIRHYFRNFIPIHKKVALEKFILIKVGKYLFNGYVDCIWKDNDGIYHIVDFKTSTEYTGKKLQKELGQLKLYTMGIVQLGVPLENIIVEWDFLKYIKVTYEQKNGKSKSRNVIRRDMVAELVTPIRMWLTHFKYEPDDYVVKAIEQNSFDCLPQEVKDKFSFGNAYTQVKLTQDDINEFENDVIRDLDELIKKEEEYKLTGDEDLWFHEITQEESYFYYSLSEYSRDKNPSWNNFLENIEMFIDKDNKGVVNNE